MLWVRKGAPHRRGCRGCPRKVLGGCWTASFRQKETYHVRSCLAMVPLSEHFIGIGAGGLQVGRQRVLQCRCHGVEICPWSGKHLYIEFKASVGCFSGCGRASRKYDESPPKLVKSLSSDDDGGGGGELRAWEGTWEENILGRGP